MMSKFLAFLLIVALCLTLVSSSPLNPNTLNKKSTVTTKLTRNDKLSNAERIARGLPLNQPKRLYDGTATHVLKARASGLRRRAEIPNK
ncbi:uncharacterized protein L201_003951 [Kwoniella dendrophila CBS 6074]|uniref:Uncharacterized protein n=1 Tax=Kwoniella dendrophila CBS 6074 TaxID=1295534 RepID=A0AAX4JVZ9_9TREE